MVDFKRSLMRINKNNVYLPSEGIKGEERDRLSNDWKRQIAFFTDSSWLIYNLSDQDNGWLLSSEEKKDIY